MRPSWKANALAGLTIGITLFVGALGAQGAPKQPPKQAFHATTVPSPKTPSDNTPSSDSRAVPRCLGRLPSAGASVACPSGGFVGEHDDSTSDPHHSAARTL